MRILKRLPILLFFTLPLLLNAQFQENNAIYLDRSISFGSHNSLVIGLDYNYKEKYSLTIKNGLHTKDGKQVPSNYSSGLCIVLFSPFNKDCIPQEETKTYEFLIGRILKINKSGTLRLNLRMGVSYNENEVPYKFTHKTSSGWLNLGSNYNYEIRKSTRFGLILNPQIEIPFWQYFGISIAPYVNINSFRVIYSGQVGVLLGLLRPRKTKIE